MRSDPITMGKIGRRYFDSGRYKADLLCKINCHSYLVEHDRVGQFESLLRDKQLGVGAVDVQAPNIETGALIAERIRAYSWLAPDQTIITSTCGFNHLPRHIALGKDARNGRSKSDPRRRLGIELTDMSVIAPTGQQVERRLRETEERFRVARPRAGSDGSSGI